MYYKHAEILCRQKMLEHGLKDWSFQWLFSGVCFGMCAHSKKQILLSMDLVQSNREPQVLDTILHEIAHALAGHKEGHSEKWRQIALSIGSNGKRCFNYDEVAAPRSGGCDGFCKCKGKRFWWPRKPKGAKICTTCRQLIVYKVQ